MMFAAITGPSTILAQGNGWETAQPMPTAREKLAACTIGNHVYAIGGSARENQPGMQTVERLNTTSGAWSSVSSMPTARLSLTAAVVDDICYAIGGRLNFGGTGFTTVEAFNPQSGSWSTRAPMPTGRFYSAATVHDGKIYVFGGASNEITILNAAEVYNPLSNSWSSLPPMPTHRAVATAAAANGRLYVFGGTNRPGLQDYPSVEVFDPASNSWGPAVAMPKARSGAAAITIGDLIYVVGGGVRANASSDVQIFDPADHSWSDAPDLLSTRVRLAVAFRDGRLYAMGGARRVTPPHPATSSVELLQLNAGPLFQIVPGLNDAWYDPTSPGQGFFISVFPDSGTIFLAWFTYDTARPAGSVMANLGEPGHRWLTAFGPYADNLAALDIEVTSGGIFDSALPAPSQQLDGTVTLEFRDCNHATLTYNIPSLGIQGVIAIERIATVNVAACEDMQP